MWRGARISPESQLSDPSTRRFQWTWRRIWRLFTLFTQACSLGSSWQPLAAFSSAEGKDSLPTILPYFSICLYKWNRNLTTYSVCRLYGKLRYVNRLDLLWEHVRRNEIEIPDFVYDHDEELEYRPMMDYGLESDHPRVYGAPAVDSPVSMYSMRCIS